MKPILTLLMACMTVLGARAQEALMLNPDAQSLGMGGVTMTTLSGSHAIFGNPAAAVFARQKMQLSGSYASLGEGNYYAASGFYNFDSRNLIQAGWRKFGMHSSYDMAVDFGYTRRINDFWSLGAVIHYQRYVGTDALSADLSFLYSRPLSFGQYSMLRIGGKLANLGDYLTPTSQTLPVNLTLGAALDTFITDAHELTVAFDAGYCFTPEYLRGFMGSVGAEYNLMQLVQLRAGYHFGTVLDHFGSVGAGVRFLHVRLDFAYLFANKYSIMNNNWCISFGFDF